jgi:hypothetical protein
MKLAHKFYLSLVLPLVIGPVFVTYLTYSRVQENSKTLTHALILQSMTARILTLMLVQDDASKAILIDPDQLAKYSEAKIAAYDESTKLLDDISSKGTTEKMSEIIRQLKFIDETLLRPIDTKILETIFEDKEEARKLYFAKYDPERTKYVDLIDDLANEGRKNVELESQKMSINNTSSFFQIGIALLFGIVTVAAAIHVLSKQIVEAQNKAAKSFEDLQYRSRVIATIYENLAPGFFLIDSNLILKEGFTKSCKNLLQKDVKVGDSFSDLLCISERDISTFRILFSQVFEDVLPEDVNLSQLPNIVKLGDRSLHLDYSVIRDDSSGKIENIMVSVSDITNQVAAQLESKRLGILINILNNKKDFCAYLQDFKESLEIAEECIERKSWLEAKQLLHTLKGNTGVFGLTNITSVIHKSEDHDSVTTHRTLS